MSLPANETHTHASRADARAALMDLDLDMDDYFVYCKDGKWGWCSNDLAEISAAADVVNDESDDELVGLLDEDDGAPAYEAPAFVSEAIEGECGEAAFVEHTGISHHAGDGLDGVDYEADANHVALVVATEPVLIAEVQTETGGSELIRLSDYRVPDVKPPVDDAPAEGARILQLGGPTSAGRATRLARLLARKLGVAITVSDATTFAAQTTVEPTACEWSHTDPKGKVIYPTDAQETFIGMCLEEGGASDEALKAAILGPDAKGNKDWIAVGESVEKFGFRFDFEYRRGKGRFCILTPIESAVSAA